jgi:hypothetical protein
MLKTPFVPTALETVRDLLRCLSVGKDDVVLDLGSGDGRIPYVAVTEFGSKAGLGVELNEKLCAESYSRFGDRIEVICGDLYFVLPALVERVTVITAYLSPMLIEELEKLLLSLRIKGVRVGLHDFPFPNVKPTKTLKSVAEGMLWPLESTLYCYEL